MEDVTKRVMKLLEWIFIANRAGFISLYVAFASKQS